MSGVRLLIAPGHLGLSGNRPTGGHRRRMGGRMRAKPEHSLCALRSDPSRQCQECPSWRGAGGSTISEAAPAKRRRSWRTGCSTSPSARAGMWWPSIQALAKRCGTWRPDEGARFDQAPRKVARGVAYWAEWLGRPNHHGDARVSTRRPQRPDRRSDWRFGKDGSVDLFTQLDLSSPIDPTGKIGNSSAPVVSNGVIVIGPALTQGGTNPNKETSRAMSWLRRAHRQETVGFPHHPAEGRARLRNLVERIGRLHRQYGRVGTAVGGRSVGIRLHRDGVANQRRLRRPSSWRQPLLRLAGSVWRSRPER